MLNLWNIPLTIRQLVTVPPLPTPFKGFEWLTLQPIRTSQYTHANSVPPDAVLNYVVYRTPTGAIWISDDAVDHQLRFCVIAHCRAAEHRVQRYELCTLRRIVVVYPLCGF